MSRYSARRPLVAGNWKMNGLTASLAEIDKIAAGMAGLGCQILVCPPATLLGEAVRRLKPGGGLAGGQNLHAKANGAFTGEISAEMLADLGASHVIIGHSERRTLFGEVDAGVRAKALAARRGKLAAIICVGETEAERKAGRALAVVGAQLQASMPDHCAAADTIVAYEPVWAIGAGLTPTVADVARMHEFIRKGLVERFADAGAAIRILYGGSVKPGNAKELMAAPEVDGALVGGASLVAADFLGVAAAYR